MILGENEILLYDDIVAGDDYSESSAATFARELRELAHERRITVRVNSAGGNLFTGLAIFDSICAARRLGRQIETRIDGAALSIASAIAIAGKPVIMGSASVMMVHQPWTPSAAGNVSELKKTIAALEAAAERLVDIYRAKTKKPRAIIEKWLADETWFSAREALAVGLCDEISTAMPRLAALCNVGDYRVPPAILAEIRGPVHAKISEVVRECAAARTARSYDAAKECQLRAADAAARLTHTPGATTQDLAICAQALERTDPWENSHHFDYGPY